jgi:hypothetical protein
MFTDDQILLVKQALVLVDSNLLDNVPDPDFSRGVLDSLRGSIIGAATGAFQMYSKGDPGATIAFRGWLLSTIAFSEIVLNP